MLLDLVEPDVMMEMVQKTADDCAEQIKHAEEEIMGKDNMFWRYFYFFAQVTIEEV